MAVTVENSAVTDIEILEANDTPNYFEHAKGIIEDIVNQQSLEVDAVSGATYSSVGIIHAVNDALESAVVEGEVKSNDTEVPSVPPQEHKGKNRHGNIHNRK